MKNVLVSIGVLVLVFGFGFTKSAFADLTKQDIEEIRKIVKEEINQEIQHINRRIDDLDSKFSTRIDDLDSKFSTRIDDLDSKFNTRIDDLKGLLYVILAGMFTLVAGMFSLVGFVLWDRRTALTPAIRKTKEIEEEEEKIKKALREYAYQEPKFATALREVGVM